MRRLAALLLALGLFGLPPGTAQAGPWAREAGDFFFSVSVQGEESRRNLMLGQLEPERFTSFYGEAGLGRRLTFGLDVGSGRYTDQTVAFLRYTFTAPERRWQFAADIGAGQRITEWSGTSRLTRVGLSVGRGFSAGGGRRWWMPLSHDGGWMSFDAVALQDVTLDQTIWQAEATLGLGLTERGTVVFTLKAEEWPDNEAMLTFLPSVVFELRPGTSLQLGGRVGLEGSDAVGLSFGLWQDF